MANSDYILEMRDICKAFPGVQALDHAQLLYARPVFML